MHKPRLQLTSNTDLTPTGGRIQSKDIFSLHCWLHKIKLVCWQQQMCVDFNFIHNTIIRRSICVLVVYSF